MDIFEDNAVYDDWGDEGSLVRTLNEFNQSSSNFTNFTSPSYGTMTTCFRGLLTLLLRVGFILIQIGCIPVSDVSIIILQNILDIACGTAAFAILGYSFAFGKDCGTVIGIDTWMMADEQDFDQAVFGWAAISISSAIITTMLSGRLHLLTTAIISMVYCGLILPTVMHWIWHESGFMHKLDIGSKRVSLKDHAGSLLIHVSGGIVGLVGLMYFGRRIMKLREICESSIGPDSPIYTFLGTILILLGLLGVSLPDANYESHHIPANYIGRVIVNSCLAGAAGIITVILFHYIFQGDKYDYWATLRCIQGTIAGVVMVSSGVDRYSPAIALFLGVFGGLLFYFMARFIHASALEDYWNAVSLHLMCGLIGTIWPPLLGKGEQLGISESLMIVHFGWQILCICIVATYVGVIFTLIFGFFTYIGFLRNRSEIVNHKRAQILEKNIRGRCFLQRFFKLNARSTYLYPGYVTKNIAYTNTIKLSPFNKLPQTNKSKQGIRDYDWLAHPSSESSHQNTATQSESRSDPSTGTIERQNQRNQGGESSLGRRAQFRQELRDKFNNAGTSTHPNRVKRIRHVFTLHSTELLPNRNREVTQFEGNNLKRDKNSKLSTFIKYDQSFFENQFNDREFRCLNIDRTFSSCDRLNRGDCRIDMKNTVSFTRLQICDEWSNIKKLTSGTKTDQTVDGLVHQRSKTNVQKHRPMRTANGNVLCTKKNITYGFCTRRTKINLLKRSKKCDNINKVLCSGEFNRKIDRLNYDTVDKDGCSSDKLIILKPPVSKWESSPEHSD